MEVVHKVWQKCGESVEFRGTVGSMVPQNAESPGGGSKELRFRVDDDVHAWLRRWARRWGVSVSSAARMMLLRGAQTHGEDGPTGYSQMLDEGRRAPLSLTQQEERMEAEGRPPEHEHSFEFQRKRQGKPGTPNSLYACACGAQEWRNE